MVMVMVRVLSGVGCQNTSSAHTATRRHTWCHVETVIISHVHVQDGDKPLSSFASESDPILAEL